MLHLIKMHLLMNKHNFNINVLSVFMKKIFQEVGYRVKCNVSTYNNMSVEDTIQETFHIIFSNYASLLKCIVFVNR